MSDQLDREQRAIAQDDELYNQNLKASLTGFREAFQGGDKFALLECVMFCAASNLSLPRWALVELARAAYKYSFRISDDFHDAIFGARMRFGRHAHAATKRKKEFEHQLWFDIVWALKQQDYKGDELYDRAIKEISNGHTILPDGTLHLSPDRDEEARQPPGGPTAETLRKTVGRMQKAGARPKFAFMFMPCGPLPTKPASA